jgi:threonine synthase
MANVDELKGVFHYHEFAAPMIPVRDIVWLGEGQTPAVRAPGALLDEIGSDFYVKLDGLNPTASFKDRGMACALSFAKHLMRTKKLENLMTVCASTGDTSAAAALYASALGEKVKSVVLLPKGYVTPQQLSQPLGAGATVFELPGVFDDCMKVVERLSRDYNVMLLNSKNPWRVLGQETWAYEVARRFDWDLGNVVLFVPVGNAGNITAVLSGLLKLLGAGVIDRLPRVVAVQSERANPVFKYYSEEKAEKRVWAPVVVKPSVAQAAMIGDPVSFPRLARLAGRFVEIAGPGAFEAVEVSEREIMEAMLVANRNGLPVCTQGGESLAGLRKARAAGIVSAREIAVVNSTAHALKFMDFQNGYFAGTLKEEYGVESDPALVNAPRSLKLKGVKTPAEASLTPAEKSLYAERASEEIADLMGLAKKQRLG